MPVELAEPVHVKHYIDTLLEKRLGPQTINGHLVAIRSFYYYLLDEEELEVANPAVRGLALRLTLQYLLGHRRIKTTMRYARLSNQKARNDYYLSMTKVEEKSGTTVTWNVRC